LEVETKEIQIKNTGSLSLNMWESFQFKLRKEGMDNDTLEKMLSNYYIKPIFYKNGEQLTIDGLTTSWTKATAFNVLYNEKKDRVLTTLKPGDTLMVNLAIQLVQNADNTFQNAQLSIDMFVGGAMGLLANSLLPNTATNSFNLFSIGILITILGILLYFLKKRKTVA
jgi:LPXTG-motif cell wall-anchored protein